MRATSVFNYLRFVPDSYPMVYTDPWVVLERFALFVSRDVQPAVRDDQVLHEQVQSMANSLRFLAREMRDKHARVGEQRLRLLATLDDVEAAVADAAVEAPALRAAVTDERERVERLDADASPYERERVLLAATDELLDRIADELPDDAAAAAREPVHDFLEAWTRARLAALRNDAEAGS